jgi:putative transposase
LFVIELESRRVHIVGSTPHPDDAFMLQGMRHLTDDIDGGLHPCSVLICDRDRKWSRPVLAFLRSAGVQVVQTPVRALQTATRMQSGSFGPSSSNACVG